MAKNKKLYTNEKLWDIYEDKSESVRKVIMKLQIALFVFALVVGNILVLKLILGSLLLELLQHLKSERDYNKYASAQENGVDFTGSTKLRLFIANALRNAQIFVLILSTYYLF